MFSIFMRFMAAPILVMLLISALVGAWLWPYTINTWLVYFGKSASIVWWQGALLGVTPYLGQASVVVAIVTWILMLFLV